MPQEVAVDVCAAEPVQDLHPGDIGLQLIHAVGRHVLGRSVVDVALLEPEVVDRLLVPPPDRPLGVMLPKRLAQLGQMVRQGPSEPDEMRYAWDHAHPPWLLAGGGPMSRPPPVGSGTDDGQLAVLALVAVLQADLT